MVSKINTSQLLEAKKLVHIVSYCTVRMWMFKIDFSLAYTPDFLINVQQVYLILTDFSFLHALIRNYMFINFQEF